MSHHLDVVFLDVGDPCTTIAPTTTPSSTPSARWARTCRTRHTPGSTSDAGRRRTAPSAALAHAFLSPDADVGALTAVAARRWAYPAGSLYDDVPGALADLSRSYRLGVIANQLASVRAAMRRDGIDPYFSVWAISEELGVEKPDPAIYTYAIERAQSEPGRTAMAGDRLDYDVVPAKRAGMHTVWVLRGEAPRHPATEQLAVPDAAVFTLRALPGALEGIGARTSGGTP